MFVDGRIEAGAPPTDYDVVIIGAGPAGITVALELASSGLRIALLESGSEEYEDGPQTLNEGRIEGNDDEFDLASSRLRFLGGTTNHWGGRCTPLDPIDFARAPSSGFTGWPFGRNVLDPYYERAQVYCDIGSFNYDVTQFVPSDPNLFLFDDIPEVETAMVRQSTPTRFGEKYRSELEADPNIHVWLYTNAVRILSDANGREAVETATLEGTARTFIARAIVVAAGAIEATRLLLWSNVQNGSRIGDAGGLLGRCYMDHPSGGAAFLHFPEPVGGKVYWMGGLSDASVPLHFVLRLSDATLEATGLPNSHHYIIPYADDQAARRRERGAQKANRSFRQLAKWGLGRDVGSSFDPGNEYCSVVTNADEYLVDRAAKMLDIPTVQRVLFKYETEQRPDLTNRIELDATGRDALGVPRPVLTWAPSDDDMEGLRETARLFGQYAGASGLGRLQLEDHDGIPFWNTTTAWHQLGTMRMAESPTSGVVDTDCRVHGGGELYVASGAVFPTVGRANPTLTIVALSIRLSDHLKRRLTG